ncbi:uncharacterized protein [Aquarana catesbeiana]|uniref:uncharacterized protein isoform X1 n=1 Tax=Aquarana catesbeiana TaxID=8400 RepID=UPI003CC9F0D6
MFSGGKGKMPNVASFIKENVNVVGNSILVMVLLGLEKIMDLEFRCPADKPLAIVYSLVFFIIPTAIVLVVACYISTGGKSSKTGTRGNSAEIKGGTEEGCIESMEISETKTETKNPKCGCCCANIKSHLFEIKVVVLWVLIVMTDGRYGDCFVKSVDELIEIKNSNISHRIPPLSWTEVRNNYLTHLFQGRKDLNTTDPQPQEEGEIPQSQPEGGEIVTTTGECLRPQAQTVIHNLCFNPHQHLEVKGFIPFGCKQFGINLGTDEKNLVLHINPRFDMFGDDRKTILNSLKDGVWGEEVKERFFPFQEGSDTVVCFHFEKCNFSIKLPTGNPLCFPVRFPIHQISYLTVGGIEVKSITLDGKIIQ